MEMARSDEPRRSRRTAGIAPLGDDKAVINCAEDLARKWSCDDLFTHPEIPQRNIMYWRREQEICRAPAFWMSSNSLSRTSAEAAGNSRPRETAEMTIAMGIDSHAVPLPAAFPR